MSPEEQAVSERAERALMTNAEAYRLAQEVVDMRRENERLVQAIRQATALVLFDRLNCPSACTHIQDALDVLDATLAAKEGAMSHA